MLVSDFNVNCLGQLVFKKGLKAANGIADDSSWDEPIFIHIKD